VPVSKNKRVNRAPVTAAPVPKGNPVKKSSRFFFYFALASLVVVVAGFTGRAVLVPARTPDITLTIAVHALIMLGWYSLVCVQANLIAGGDRALHMRLGKLSPVLMVAILISGTLVTLETYARRISEGVSAPELAVYLSFSSLLGFVLLYGLAYRMRGQGDFHKRYMVLAGAAMMLAATFRLAAALGAPREIDAGIIIQYALITALVFYDMRTLNRIHSATIIGTLVCLVMTIGIFTVGSSDVWATLIKGIFIP
jgi:hypothetical protein